MSTQTLPELTLAPFATVGQNTSAAIRTALLGNLRANHRTYPYHGYPPVDEGWDPPVGTPGWRWESVRRVEHPRKS